MIPRLVRSLIAVPALLAVTLLGLMPLPKLQAQAAATGIIRGRVLNEGTGQYLRSAEVTVVGTNISTTSEAGGNFTLTGVPAGSARVAVVYAGLDRKEIPITVNAGETANLEVGLTSADYAPKNVVKLAEFVVATEREGNARAIMEQRESLNMKTVIASDAFGDVSEGNIGEFLKLMPGVMLDYVEADARTISIAGMDPKYTTILMDGAPVASAGSSDLGVGRVTELEQLSVSSIETIELNRTPTPEVSGSALAGVVNLRSKGAFDRKGRQISFQAVFSANSLDLDLKKTPGPGGRKTFKLQPNLSFQYSDIFLGGKLGVLAGYNYSYSFAEQKAITYTWAFDADPSNNRSEIPRLNSISLRDSPKPTTRKNYNLRLDYKFSNDLRAWARLDYNTYAAQFYSRDLGFTFGSTIVNAPGSTVPANPAIPYSLTSQTSTATSVNIGQGGGSTNKHGATTTIGGGFNFQRGNFGADVQAQYSRSTNWYKDIPFGWVWSVNPGNLTGIGMRWERSSPTDPNMYLTQTSGPDWRNLANYPNGFSVTTNDRAGEDQKYNVKGDFRYKLASDRLPPTDLRFGASVNQTYRYIKRRLGNNMNHLGADGLPNTADDAIALYAEPEYRMNWPFGGNLNGVPNTDRFKLAQEFGANPSYFAAIPQSTILQQTLQTRATVKEQLDAIYAQTIFKIHKKFDFAPGVRWERTRGEFDPPASLTDAQTRLALTGSRTGTVVTTSPEYIYTRYNSGRKIGHADYNTLLKYMHFNYRATPNMLARLSYNESISRPDLNRLAGTITINNDTAIPPTASIGNPDLNPEMARNVYASLEYYLPARIGMVSVSFSRRDLKDLIRSETIDVPIDGTFDDDPQWAGWRLSTFRNVAKSHNSSVELTWRQELNFLPRENLLRGVGFFANYTQLYYDDYENYRRPPNLISGGVNYRIGRLLARWNTTFTPGHRSNATPANGWANYNDEKLFHDLQLNYRLYKNYNLTVTGRNVLHSPQSITYTGARQDVMTRYLDVGSIWTFGVKATY